jgi:hypothetical protein
LPGGSVEIIADSLGAVEACLLFVIAGLREAASTDVT